ncbi:ATP-binding protein [Pedobacter immunditicola]|uniref:ATP-binding protein n=1 Tax=Pedobacter immunditicola TaxID=3133440 RepID=UPI0030B22A38
MKKLFGLSIAVLLGLNVNAQHKLVKIWETDSIINMPESVLHDAKANVLYVAIMGNSADAKDSIGGIGIFETNGKVKNMDWVTGLNSPKGMAIVGDKLYIADISDIVVVDIPKAKVEQRIPVEGAVFLNDVTASDKGIVYVSDSRTKRIHQLADNKVSVYLENIDGVNGLKSVGEVLYIAGGGKGMLKADAKKNLTKMANVPQGGDGIEPVGNGDFIYSSWPGYVYYVYADGRNELLLDTHLEKINTADIGYDPVKRIVYIPTFFKKSVMAYQLK